MLFGNKRKTKVYQPPAKTLRGKLRQSKAGINMMATTASNMGKKPLRIDCELYILTLLAEYGRAFSKASK